MPYVEFVSDDDFLRCVEHVCDSYPGDVRSLEPRTDNGIDPFKMVFDVMNYETSLQDFKEREIARQSDKTVNNTIGEFHQMLLGSVDGWSDLGTGDETKLDLGRNDGTVFMELKNRFNTVNSDSLNKVREKLERNAERYPGSVNYWAYLVSKNGNSGESDWRYRKRTVSGIRKIWGNAVYGLVTGEAGSLREAWDALPGAINDVRRTSMQLSDLEEMIGWFDRAF